MQFKFPYNGLLVFCTSMTFWCVLLEVGIFGELLYGLVMWLEIYWCCMDSWMWLAISYGFYSGYEDCLLEISYHGIWYGKAKFKWEDIQTWGCSMSWTSSGRLLDVKSNCHLCSFHILLICLFIFSWRLMYKYKGKALCMLSCNDWILYFLCSQCGCSHSCGEPWYILSLVSILCVLNLSPKLTNCSLIACRKNYENVI